MKSTYMSKSQPPKPKATVKKIMVNSKTGKKTVGESRPMGLTSITQEEFFNDGKKKVRSEYVGRGPSSSFRRK